MNFAGLRQHNVVTLCSQIFIRYVLYQITAHIYYSLRFFQLRMHNVQALLHL